MVEYLFIFPNTFISCYISWQFMLCTPKPPTVSWYFRGSRRPVGRRCVKECGSSVKHLVREARLAGLANLRAQCIGMGGRDLVYKCMGFVVESVLQQACVRLVCTSVGLAGLGLEALVAG